MKEIIAELDKILPVVERVHGEHHPELHTVAGLYTDWKEKANPALLAQLREVTSDFTPPKDACPTYRKAYSNLALLFGELS